MTFQKAALAVFVGVIAAHVAINTPRWISAAFANYIHVHAVTTIEQLTPDILIQKCGKPLDDHISKLDDTTSSREISYTLFKFTFWRSDKQWLHPSVVDTTQTNLPDAETVLLLMSCLKAEGQ
jgi:hypothetical protein